MAAALFLGSRARASNGSRGRNIGARVRGVGEGGAREPREVHGVRDARHLQRDVHDLSVDRIGARERGAARQLRHHDQIARIELRNEPCRRLAELVEAVGDHPRIDHEHHHRKAHDPGGEAPIAASQRFEAAVEQPEEAMHGPHPPASCRSVARVRLQQQRGHCRRQGQRDDEGDHRRPGDRKRELAVELSGDARDEGRRHEHRAQHEGNGDQGGTHLIHALVRGLARGEAGRDVALDVLHHDDRIVHHDADGEHQAEQGKVVERETEQRHEEEGADERYRDGDDRDDGGAPGLQEQDHHQNDQDDRFDDGLDDGVHGLLNELGRIVDDRVLEPLREIPWRARPWSSGSPSPSQARSSPGAGRCRVRRRDRGRDRNSWCSREPPTRPWPHLSGDHGRGGLLDQDLGELGGIGKPTQRLHRHLERARLVHGRLARARPRRPAHFAPAWL